MPRGIVYPGTVQRKKKDQSWRKPLAIFLIVLGILDALYCGGYLGFYGGLVEIIHCINLIAQGHAVNAPVAAWGVIRFIFGPFFGLLAFICFSYLAGKVSEVGSWVDDFFV